MVDDEDSLHERVSRLESQLVGHWLLDDERFDAARREVRASFDSSKEAVLKAELATDKRFESVNEFRAQQTEIIGLFMPRAEYEAKHKALVDKINALSDRVGSGEAATTAVQQFKGYLVGIVGLIVVVGGIAVSNFLAR